MAERIYRNTGVVVAIGSGKYILYLRFLISVHDTRGCHFSFKQILLLSPFFLKKKKTLTGKEDHSNDILPLPFYCHSYRTSNQNSKTGGCTLHSLPQLTHKLKHYFL